MSFYRSLRRVSSQNALAMPPTISLEEEEQEHRHDFDNTGPGGSKGFRIARRLLGDTGGGLAGHRSRTRRPRDTSVSSWTASTTKTRRAAVPAGSTASLAQAWSSSTNTVTGGCDDDNAVRVGNCCGG